MQDTKIGLGRRSGGAGEMGIASTRWHGLALARPRFFFTRGELTDVVLLLPFLSVFSPL